MPLLNPAAPATLTPQRPDDDGMGNTDWTDLDPTQAVVVLDQAAPSTDRGAKATHSGKVFVPRGYDLQAGDRITWQTTHFTVYGLAMGDMDHPLTGDDFGWKWYQIKGGR